LFVVQEIVVVVEVEGSFSLLILVVFSIKSLFSIFQVFTLSDSIPVAVVVLSISQVVVSICHEFVSSLPSNLFNISLF
jgi:hypothetical protein